LLMIFDVWLRPEFFKTYNLGFGPITGRSYITTRLREFF
jgi:hypothetical protein